MENFFSNRSIVFRYFFFNEIETLSLIPFIGMFPDEWNFCCCTKLYGHFWTLFNEYNRDLTNKIPLSMKFFSPNKECYAKLI